MIGEGDWWVWSKSDPRWNGSGTGFVGGLYFPQAARDFVEAKRKELNEPLPDDLEFGYMKH